MESASTKAALGSSSCKQSVTSQLLIQDLFKTTLECLDLEVAWSDMVSDEAPVMRGCPFQSSEHSNIVITT